MVSTTKTDRTEKLGIALPISLLQKIDNRRGDIPRSTFIWELIWRQFYIKQDFPTQNVNF